MQTKCERSWLGSVRELQMAELQSRDPRLVLGLDQRPLVDGPQLDPTMQGIH